MELNVKKIIKYLIGIFLIIFGIYAMDYSIYIGHTEWIFWLCYIAMVLIGFGALTNNSFLIVSQLNLVAIPLIFWIIDFILYYFFKYTFWGISHYFFNGLTLAARIISLEHLFLVPLALIVLYLIKIKNNKAWILSITQLVIFFFLTKYLTPDSDNINCVFTSCVPFISDSFYIIKWFILGIICILTTNYILISLPFLKK